jgi:hypothetical protein
MEPLAVSDSPFRPKKFSLLQCRCGAPYIMTMWFAWIAAIGAKL